MGGRRGRTERENGETIFYSVEKRFVSQTHARTQPESNCGAHNFGAIVFRCMCVRYMCSVLAQMGPINLAGQANEITAYVVNYDLD